MSRSNVQIIYTPPPVLYKNTINEKECVEKTELDIFNALNFIISAAQGTPNINPKYSAVSSSTIMTEWLNCIGDPGSNKTFSTSYSPKIDCPENNDTHNADATTNYTEDNLIKALHALAYISKTHETTSSS
jgi:hypothetical protein